MKRYSFRVQEDDMFYLRMEKAFVRREEGETILCQPFADGHVTVSILSEKESIQFLHLFRGMKKKNV